MFWIGAARWVVVPRVFALLRQILLDYSTQRMHVPGVCGLMRRRGRPCRPRATSGAVTNALGILGETGAAERAAGAWNGGFTGMKKLLIGLGVVVVQIGRAHV